MIVTATNNSVTKIKTPSSHYVIIKGSTKRENDVINDTRFLSEVLSPPKNPTAKQRQEYKTAKIIVSIW